MARKSSGSGRAFALIAAVLLLLSAIALLMVGILFLGIGGVLSSGVPGLNSTSSSLAKTASIDIELAGVFAVIIGIFYLVSMIGVVQGKRTYGYQLGVVLSAIAIVMTLVEMVLLPAATIILSTGLIFPLLILLFLYLGRNSFR